MILSDHLLPPDWGKPEPMTINPAVLAQMDNLIAEAKTAKAKRFYENRKAIYLGE